MYVALWNVREVTEEWHKEQAQSVFKSLVLLEEYGMNEVDNAVNRYEPTCRRNKSLALYDFVKREV
jgi:hypothetical protein